MRIRPVTGTHYKNSSNRRETLREFVQSQGDLTRIHPIAGTHYEIRLHMIQSPYEPEFIQSRRDGSRQFIDTTAGTSYYDISSNCRDTLRYVIHCNRRNILLQYFIQDTGTYISITTIRHLTAGNILLQYFI